MCKDQKKRGRRHWCFLLTLALALDLGLRLKMGEMPPRRGLHEIPMMCTLKGSLAKT